MDNTGASGAYEMVASLVGPIVRARADYLAAKARLKALENGIPNWITCSACNGSGHPKDSRGEMILDTACPRCGNKSKQEWLKEVGLPLAVEGHQA